ncbi:MAG TPA: hypothetical protein VIG45_02195 [Erysipelothrix sp.]
MKKIIIILLTLLLVACNKAPQIPLSYHKETYVLAESRPDLDVKLEVVDGYHINMIMENLSDNEVQIMPLKLEVNDYIKDTFITTVNPEEPSSMIFHFVNDEIYLGFINKAYDKLEASDFAEYQTLVFVKERRES